MVTKDFKGIIFDIHRTLVDDSGFPRERILSLMERSGVTVNRDEYYALYDSITRKLFYWPDIYPFIKVREIHRQRLMQLYSHFEVSRDIEADMDYLWESLGHCKMYPEVPEVLSLLDKRFKLALLTNADSDDPLLKIIKKSGADFDVAVTSDEVKCYKPAEKIFNYTLSKLNLKPEQVVMVGDSLVADIAGAQQCGIFSVWINRYNKKIAEASLMPDLEIKNLTELLSFLKL